MDTIKRFNKIISKKIFDELPKREFSMNEFIIGLEDETVVLILEGTVKAVRYEEDSESVFPLLFKEGDFVGFNMNVMKYFKNWEIVASSKKVKVAILKKEFIEKYILNDIKALKFFLEKCYEPIEAASCGFYIHSRGGAKAYLAFLLIKNAVNGEFIFTKYSELTNILNVSKTFLFRITKEFIDSQLIVKKRNKIIILDRGKLMDFYRKYTYYL